jgi:hypothetical protein
MLDDEKMSADLFLPMGTLDPVEKWQSCLLRVRMGLCPNISGLEVAIEASLEVAPESPMSISRMNHLSGLFSTIGEDGVDWMAVKRSMREPNPKVPPSDPGAPVFGRFRMTVGPPAKVDCLPQRVNFTRFSAIFQLFFRLFSIFIKVYLFLDI